jgi:DNA-binding MarR family transcriptional regulator
MDGTIETTLKTWVDVFMHRSMRNIILFMKENGLSMSQVGALFCIHRNGACGVSDIADDLGITCAAASQMLERLVQQDLVLRSEDPHDRRLKHIVLTGRSEQILHGGINARQSWLDDLAKLLDPAEQEQVLSALQILIEKTNHLEEIPFEASPLRP